MRRGEEIPELNAGRLTTAIGVVLVIAAVGLDKLFSITLPFWQFSGED